MKSLHTVYIQTDASNRLPNRVAYLFKQNQNLTKLFLYHMLFWPDAEKIIEILPKRLKSLQYVCIFKHPTGQGGAEIFPI
jgi:hypothetical protein